MPDDKNDTLFEMPEPSSKPGKSKSSKPKKDPNAPENLGKAIRLPTPDFDDPNRKPTCLEVDFPIAPINALSNLEGNAGKPIYQMSKWWARRRSSVFRSLLIAAATEAPDDPEQASKRVWDHYYCNHQKAGSFRKLKVLDIFMGGGTTLVEGSRLGMQVTGVDLNPVAWFVTKNELAGSDPEQVKALFDHIEAEVKPVIQPFYTTTCPRGHQGKWIEVATGQEADVDPLTLSPDERKLYRWEGPEVIYTFWAKHGPCKAPSCNHRTPIFRSPIVAEKSLGTKYLPLTCPACAHEFHAELGETRMAPGVERVVLDSEFPFTEMTQPFAQLLNDYQKGKADDKRERLEAILEAIDQEPGLHCPKCNTFAASHVKRVIQRHKQDGRASAVKKKELGILPARNGTKTVPMYLVMHQDWLKGASGVDDEGNELGGFAGAAPEASTKWYERRLEGLRLVEIRGTYDASEPANETELTESDEDGGSEDGGSYDEESADHVLPPEISLADGAILNTQTSTVPAQASFLCQGCGLQQSFLESSRESGHSSPVSGYVLQCHCPSCEMEGFNYNGRYFKPAASDDIQKLAAAEREWSEHSQSELQGYWPEGEIQFSMRTHVKDPLPDHGYTHWWKLFGSRQLLVHSRFLKCITLAGATHWPLDVAEQALGAFQQYLRMMSMFSFWHQTYDKLAPSMSNANYNPKQRIVETNVYGALGYGRWPSCCSTVLDAMHWAQCPWESAIAAEDSKAKSVKTYPEDSVTASEQLLCGSSTELANLNSNGYDFVVTDPPFGDNLYYADLADFFYVWLRIPLQKWYEGLPEEAYFKPERTPHAVEAIDNPVEHPDDRLDHEKERFITQSILAEVRELSGDKTLQVDEPNPTFRPVPSGDFYCQTLTACWAEAGRKLKPGGLLAFTFHHSEDAPWVDVLESLFNAGYILVATYPIRSDETKGAKAEFGSKKIEYDIIHVCRKRLEAPQPVSYARMRRWVKQETARLKNLLEHTHGEDMLESDLLVILRGKALEFYSRHYGQVLTGDGEILPVRDALVGINQLLEDLFLEGSGEERPPENIEPATRLFLHIFRKRREMSRDDLGKTLRGTGMDQGDLEARGWIRTHGTTVHVVPVQDRWQYYTLKGRTRKVLKTDLDKAYFLIGAAMPGSGIKIEDELDKDSFNLSRKNRGVDAILDWLSRNNPDPAVQKAAKLAGNILAHWRSKPSQKSYEDRQLSFFQNLEIREDDEEDY